MSLATPGVQGEGEGGSNLEGEIECFALASLAYWDVREDFSLATKCESSHFLTCISYKFGHQVASLALPWISFWQYQLISPSATSHQLFCKTSLRQFEKTKPIDWSPGTPVSDKKEFVETVIAGQDSFHN